MHFSTPILSVVLLALSAPAGFAQQGGPVDIGGRRFVDAQAVVQTATGKAFTGMLGVCVDNAGHYWVSSRRDATATPHALFEFDANGAFLASFNQPAATATSAWGIRDLALDPGANVIYGGLEGTTIHAFDVATGAFDPAKDISVTGGVTNGVIRALALDATAGTFYTVNFQSDIQTIDQATGVASAATMPGVSTGSYGAALLRSGGTLTGLWILSQTGSRTGPTAPGKGLNMIEVDPATGVETGNYFYGDFIDPGVAGGAEMHSLGGEPVLVCLSQGVSDGFFAMRVTDVYGTGCGGRVDYTGGNAYAGNGTFAIEGTGITAPNSFMLISWGPTPMPLPTIANCDLLLNFPVITATPGPVVSGSAVWNLPIPVGAAEGEIYFQLVEFRGTLPVDLTNGLKLAIQP